MATINLTEGAIEAMCNGDHELKPVLQVHDIRLVNTQSGASSTTERYRLLLSDGVNLQQGMLATQKNELVKSGQLQKNSIILLKQSVCNVIQHRTIIIIIDLDVLQEECVQIGSPKQYVPPFGDQTGMNSGNPPASGPNPRPGVAGVLQQPKMEHGAQMQSYGGSVNNPVSGQYAANNGSPLHSNQGFGAGNSAQMQSYGGSVNNSVSGQYTANNGSTSQPKPGFAAGNSVNTAGAGSYGGALHNAKNEYSHVPPNTSARYQQPGYQQPPSMYINRGPTAKNEAPPRIVPIAALNPYQGRWTIRARVTAKADLRQFNNTRGDGKVFSFDLLDSDGGEIRVTCFNAVADQFYDLIEVGKVYLISKGSLKPAQKNFNHLPNDFEIWLEITSVVQPCLEEDSRIPKQQFHFRPISEIESMENNAILDVIGVVSSITPSSSIMTKKGTETQKRSLQLKDISGRSVELTLWGNLCNSEGQTLQNMCDSGNFPVLAVKSAKVGEFNGKNLGTLLMSQLFIEPDFPEAQRLKEWFVREGKNIPSVSISRDSVSTVSRNDVRSTVSQIKDEKLGTSEKPDWITVCATVTFVKMDNFCYTACPNSGDRPCNKKVTNNGDGTWRCDKCDQTVGECLYRYVLQFQIQDHTATTWVTAFQENGEEIMGISAKDLYFLKYEAQDDEKFNEIGRAAVFKKYIFKLKVKEETFNDEQRVKSTVVKAERADFISESRCLLEALNKFKAGELGPTATKSEQAIPLVGANRFGPSQPVASGISYGTNPGLSGREMGMYTSNTSQYGNQYSGGYGGGMSSGMLMTCSSCGGTGHSAANCPSINHSPGVFVNQTVPSGSNVGQCYKCQKPGHFARDCPGISSVPPAYGASNMVPGRFGGGIQRQHVGGF